MPYQDDETTPEEGDEYISMEFLRPRGDGYQSTTVAHMKQNIDK